MQISPNMFHRCDTVKSTLADQYQMKLSKQDYHLYPFTELELYWYLLDNLASFFL